MMYKAVFKISDLPQAYVGYTSGADWNGWATPYFEIADAKRVMTDNNEIGQYHMQYDEINDKFYTVDEEGREFEIWQGEDIKTEEGIKHLYGIGAYSWIWDELTEETRRYLAEVVENLIYELDTYGYRDVGIDRDEMVEVINAQLKDPNTYRKVYEIWNHELLDADGKFDALCNCLRG